MKKNVLIFLTLLLALVLLSGSLLVACHPATPDQPDDPGSDEQPDEPAKPEKPKPNYVYPDGEYEKALEVFGSREENFAEGKRTAPETITSEFDMVTGKYVQHRPETRIVGPRTYASVDRQYSPAMHINADAYDVPAEYADAYKRAGYSQIGTGGSFNKTELTDTQPTYLQINANGTTDGLWGSAVLTKKVVEYKCRMELNSNILASTWNIGYAEPEMFRSGVYGNAYKDLWQIKYESEWVDPTTSVNTEFMAERLNLWTHTNAIRMYLSYICAKKPTFDSFMIAPHSTLAYSLLGVTDGYVHMMGTGLVRLVTGQTWSNTIENKIRYEGNSIMDPFINALLDYGTYLDAADYYGADFYALCDPMSDTSATTGTEDYWRDLCHVQLVASLMYPEINRWQLIWTNRSFLNVSDDYRSEQLAIHNALLDISGKEFKLTAGTPGITYLLSDTLTWQAKGKSAYDGFWGVAGPLLYDGIPLRTRAMELVTGAEDLDGVSLLIVSHDNQKPLYEESNEGIAEWVRAGGTLLYLGGYDSYSGVDNAFWNEKGKGGSPLGNLLLHLGLDGVKVSRVAKSGKLSFADTSIRGNAGGVDPSGVLTDTYAYRFEGEGFEPILQSASGDVIGIRAEVGKGSVVIVGLSTADYTKSEASADLLRGLVEYSLNGTDYDYVPSDNYIAERGDYVAVYSLHGETKLSGTFVNIFSSSLEIVKDPVVGEKETALYYRVNTDVTMPKVLYMGGVLETLEEGNDVTVVCLHSAENAAAPIRIVAPEGLYPQSVTVTVNDRPVGAEAHWDDKTHSLVVFAYSTPTTPARVTVRWGTASGTLKEYRFEQISYNVCKDGDDEPFIIKNTGVDNGDSRRAEFSGEIIWGFNVSGKRGVQIEVSLGSNFLLEISGNGEDWTEVSDFSKLDFVRSSGTNQSKVNILLDTYPDIGNNVFLRLRNTSNTSGWGGTVSRIRLRYLVEQ